MSNHINKGIGRTHYDGDDCCPNPQAHTLDEQIRKAIKAYKIAGGDPEFYIISKSDHDRNWAQAVTEARIDELESMEVKRPHNSGEEICISFKGKSRKLRLKQLKENR